MAPQPWAGHVARHRRGIPLRAADHVSRRWVHGGGSTGQAASGCARRAREPGRWERAVKEDRVRTGRAHAALVLDQDGAAQGWCQYGSPEELPGIKHRREYDKDAPPRPDWRITCFYVDKKHRGQGTARAALEGALDQIAHAGGHRRSPTGRVADLGAPAGTTSWCTCWCCW